MITADEFVRRLWTYQSADELRKIQRYFKSESRQHELFDLYLRRHDRINNWDLVEPGGIASDANPRNYRQALRLLPILQGGSDVSGHVIRGPLVGSGKAVGEQWSSIGVGPDAHSSLMATRSTRWPGSARC